MINIIYNRLIYNPNYLKTIFLTPGLFILYKIRQEAFLLRIYQQYRVEAENSLTEFSRKLFL